MSDHPKVLISYSHDSSEHAQRVLQLANRLRADGIDCMIDQYVVAPAEGWPRWMDKQIRDSDFVVMVCSETYYRRAMGEEDPGKGLGVRWEGHLIYQAIYIAESMNTKFIPVLFESGNYAHIPAPVQSTTFYFVQTEDGYENLYRRLTDQPSALKPTLGKLRSLPPAERKSEGTVGWEAVLSDFPDRNPFFTGREQVLVQLQEALADRSRAALGGLGGVGKTQTAVEYTHRHFDEYAYMFWTTAHSREALVSGYGKIAALLNLPESKDKNQTVAVEAVKRWLSSNQRWLLILDNADDLTIVREFIPSGRNGHVVLTTRAQAVGGIARFVRIREMELDEGALFLLRRAEYIAEEAPLDAATEDDQARAKEITAQLDGLPLALDQAAAYIEATDCGLLGYLDLYRKHAPELLRQRGELAAGHPDPVATTWALSFEKIEQANSTATELLKFCAFLHPDAIPEELFHEGAPELGPELEALVSDALAFNSAIAEILRYSLLRRDPNSRTLEIHRLVQAVLKQAMNDATQRQRAERAVRVVNRAFPEVEFSNWALCERLLPQAQTCAELVNQWGFEFPAAARLLNEAGDYLFERGRYADAKPVFERALTIRARALGPEHPHVASSLNSLAGLYNAQGQYGKAEPLYQRSLAILEKALGPEHPHVGSSLNNLAELYRIQGKYARAKPYYQRALVIKEKVLGPQHPQVVSSVNNLALLYQAMGDYVEAEPLYQRALVTLEKAVGPEHPSVASSLNNLAELYRIRGKYAKANPLFQRSLAIREKMLGPQHPDVAATLNNLAALYHNQGQFEKAASLYERARKILQQALGPDHASVAMSFNNLAELYKDMGDYAGAEPLYRHALVTLEKALGPEHPYVATCLDNLAGLLRKMHRRKEAPPLEFRARAIRARRA